MRTFLAALCFVTLTVIAGCSPSSSEADVATIKAVMTPDHVSVTHYYGTAQTVDEQIASLPDLKYEQTNLTEPSVVMLADDVAMRTLTAKFDGTYKGKSISGPMFITSIMAKRDGKWLEQFYQVTHLVP